MPVHDLGHAVEVLLELPDKPALADPTLADDRDQPWPSLRPGGEVEVLEHPELGSATDERRFELSVRPDPPRRATTRSARYAGTGAALPFRICSPAGSNAIASAAALVGRLPDEDGPGRARPTGVSTRY